MVSANITARTSGIEEGHAEERGCMHRYVGLIGGKSPQLVHDNRTRGHPTPWLGLPWQHREQVHETALTGNLVDGERRAVIPIRLVGNISHHT
jgi:hypothetical protein